MAVYYDFYVYIMASESGTLYIGFTNNLERRVSEHKQDLVDGFSKKYQCHKLVYYEHYTDVNEAIAREKQLKRWNRKKKERLIATINPGWKDLSEGWYETKEPASSDRSESRGIPRLRSLVRTRSLRSE